MDRRAPRRGPPLILVPAVLEAEVCATSERKRRQRANRHRDPLDQLHGTSLPVSGERSHGPNGVVLTRLTNPLLGDTGAHYRGSP
jgi:hypothetical protein